MKIIFICGSIEPGRDGVGDYTRRLAGELLRQGHQVAIMALHDLFVDEREESIGNHQDGEQLIPTLRLSNQSPWTDRVRRAKAFIKSINPDWISLQFVIFSFHEKGLPFGLSSVLKELSGDKPIHIMFHELWVGMWIEAPKRHVWWGHAQRYLIRSLLRTLCPQVVHTHAHLYQLQLGRLGVRALLLPLFSNIPKIDGLQIASTQVTDEEKHSLNFVFFGGIAPGSPVRRLANEVALYASQKGLTVDLIIIGRSGCEQETWAAAWRAHNLSVQILGEQSPVNISRIISQSSIGLSTTPAILSGKSGSVAAMHAHGLPVLCVCQPCHPTGINQLQAAPGTFQYSIGNFHLFMDEHSRMNLPSKNLADITHQFVDNLLSFPSEEIII